MGVRSTPRFRMYVEHARREIAAMNAAAGPGASSLLPYLEAFDMVAPFRDCTRDGSHLTYGVSETILWAKILPWLCPIATFSPASTA